MQPTLRDGDLLLVRWGGVPTPGAVVVCRLPDGTAAVKRVLAADPDGWWVERDNPAEGVDSWLVGAIRPGDMLGLVVCRLWPPRRLRRISPRDDP